MGTDCKSAAFSFGGSNPPAPTKKALAYLVRWSFLFCSKARLTGRVDSNSIDPPNSPAGKKAPCGAFLDARLATSTRAHQKTSTYASTLRFLFCSKARLTGRVDSNSSGADRCLRQKQGGAVGAAASRMRVPPKAQCSRWEPRPGFLFILRGSRHPPAPTKKTRAVKPFRLNISGLLVGAYAAAFCKL